MQFVSRQSELGNCIYMDMEGLELGIRDGVSILTEESSINFEDMEEMIEPFKYFKVDTYNVLKPNNKNYSWNHVFGNINDFLNRYLDNDERRIIAETFIAIHYDITSQMKYGTDLTNNLVSLTRSFSRQIDRMDTMVNLCPKLEQYVRDNIPVPDFEGAGSRPQDTKSMTFEKEHVIILTSIALLSKLLCPILGVFIEHCRKQIDSSLKDLHCVDIMADVLDKRYELIINKLKKYIRNITKPMIKDEMRYIVNGYTLELASQKNFANILVRRLVGGDLFKENGNLMTYITASIRECNRNPPFTAMNSKCAIEELATPSENTASTNEDGNKSTLESGSRSSANTVDYPILIEAAAADLIRRTLIDEDLDEKVFNECIKYYNRNLFSLNPINTYLIGNAFGYPLGGSKSIWLLSISDFIKLSVLLQMILFKRGYYSLIPIISMIQHAEPKNIQTKEDGILKSSWNASFPYRNCKNKFNLNINGVDFDTQIRSIVECLINNNFINNLPYVFYEMCNTPDLNNTIYEYPDTIIKDICSYIWDIIVGAQEIME